MTNHHLFVRSLTEIRAGDLAQVGGKGANLGEMMAAGFPVPPGFCVTTPAFESFMEDAHDSAGLYDLLDTVIPDNLDQAKSVGQQIRSRLMDIPIPQDVAHAIRFAWQGLGQTHSYAVRSSATAEDLPDASFAGQQDTYLNIRGEDDLLDAVRRCWVSLFTDRAILYRIQNDFSHRDVSLSVVIQQMVLAQKSGTMFTADPLTGHRHTLTIDASFGLGEALVSGLVSPDSYQLDKRTRRITHRHVSQKEVAIYPEPGGGTRREELHGPEREQLVLEDSTIHALADLGIRAENHYRTPQDIEWAIADEEIFLVQARPITSLYPIEGLASPDETMHVFFSMGHQQSMTGAMPPLSLSTIQALLPSVHERASLNSGVLRSVGGRLFADVTPLLRHPIARRIIPRLLSQFDALAPEMIREATRRPEFRGSHGLHPSFRSIRFAAGLVRRVVRTLFRTHLTGFVGRTNALVDEFLSRMDQQIAASSGRQKLGASLNMLRQVPPLFLHWVPEAAVGIISARLLSRIGSKRLTPEQTEALTLGIPGNVVNEMNLAIGDLADTARRSPELAHWFSHLDDGDQTGLEGLAHLSDASPFLSAWDAFLSRYGSRGPSEIDLMLPRWSEDPLPVLQVIASAIRREESYRDRYENYVGDREVAYQALLEAAGVGVFGRLRTRFIKRLYHVMTQVGGMREHHKFLAVRALAMMREVLKGAASDLVSAGKLASTEDIWFLDLREVTAIWDAENTDWADLIARRLTEFGRYKKMMPPVIITSDGESPVVRFQVDDAPDGALLGNPVSAGVVEGSARVIRDPNSESLAPGEILIAQFTDPGWTPLFINAGGLVLEVGGALTHGAVVAREYGIPAVVGVRNAIHTIQTGQRVRVDGSRGIVEIIGDRPNAVPPE